MSMEVHGESSLIAAGPGKRGEPEFSARKREIHEFSRPQQKEPESGAVANQACDEQEVESGNPYYVVTDPQLSLRFEKVGITEVKRQIRPGSGEGPIRPVPHAQRDLDSPA